MILAKINRTGFDYDIHSLIKAFYPQDDVTVAAFSEDTGLEQDLPKSPVDFEIRFEGCIPEPLQRGREAEPAAQEGSSEGRICVLAGSGADGAVYSELFAAGTLRAQIKSLLKRLLYQALKESSGKELPWGTLTGIRPTKIPMAMLEKGMKNTEIADYMRKTYYTSPQKTALAISIANRERHILQGIDFENGYSLYVGIPFCPSICLYCSFSSSPIGVWKDQVDAYLDALIHEIEECAGLFSGRILNSVYIGGGTPTTLEPGQMDRLLTALERHFDYRDLLEFTVEAGRPDSITEDKLKVLRDHGISRISVNPQTMNQKTLDLIGRRHTVIQTKEAFALARKLGFDNINMDLIVGLPGEGEAEVEHTMKELALLSPDSITVHSLAVKRAARLNIFRDEYREMTFENNSRIMDMTARYAALQGCFPYYLYRQKNMAGNFENVGYARPGKEGLYNILIMEEVQSILALGAGASTKLLWENGRIERVENVKDIRSYMERIDEMIERKRSGMGIPAIPSDN